MYYFILPSDTQRDCLTREKKQVLSKLWFSWLERYIQIWSSLNKASAELQILRRKKVSQAEMALAEEFPKAQLLISRPLPLS